MAIEFEELARCFKGKWTGCICRTDSVNDNDDAAPRKFLGSPSFRVNGNNLWEEDRDTYSLSCRVYATSERMKGSPSISMLQEAIRQAIDKAQYRLQTG